MAIISNEWANFIGPCIGITDLLVIAVLIKSLLNYLNEDSNSNVNMKYSTEL